MDVPPLDRAAFARLALDLLRRARPGDALVVDEDRFAIVGTDADGRASLANLANFYDEYLHAAPAARAAVLDRMVGSAARVDGQETLDEVRISLVPRIRPRRYFEIDRVALARRLAGGTGANHGPYTPFADHLGVQLAIDRPDVVEYVGDPARYGVPLAELDAVALANLRRMTRTGLERVRDGLYLGCWGDEYAAERMLLPEVFEGLALDGDPVVFLPGAERIYVVGSRDEGMLALVLKLVDDRLAKPRGLLAHGFVRLGGQWRFFQPPGALGRELGGRLARSLADAYATQKEDLDEEPLDPSEPHYVPNVLGIGSDARLLVTSTTWTDGVRALLPRADIVAVGRLETGELATVAWDELLAVAGDCLAPVPGLYPPRWETRRFPDDAAFARLKGAAVDLGEVARASRPPPAPSAEVAPDVDARAAQVSAAWGRAERVRRGRTIVWVVLAVAAILAGVAVLAGR